MNYTTGTSKEDICIAAVMAHPHVTPIQVLEYAPLLGPASLAAALMDKLYEKGRFKRSLSGDYLAYSIADGAPAAKVEETPEVPPRPAEKPEVHPRLAVEVLATVAAFPGTSAVKVFECMTIACTQEQVSLELHDQIKAGKLQQRREHGVFAYYAAGVEMPGLESVRASAALLKKSPEVRVTQVERPSQTEIAAAAATKWPGLKPAEIAAMDPRLKDGTAASLALGSAFNYGLLERQRKPGEKAFRYWPPGQIPDALAKPLEAAGAEQNELGVESGRAIARPSESRPVSNKIEPPPAAAPATLPPDSSRVVAGLKIESGIPLPGQGRDGKGRSASATAALAMEVGDSFLIETDNPIQARNRVKSALRRSPELKDRIFASRKVVGGLRIWRTT